MATAEPPEEQATDQDRFKLELDNDQMLLTSAALHMLSHFAVEDSPTHKCIQDIREGLRDQIPEQGEQEFRFTERIGKFCWNFFSCTYCERVMDTHNTITAMVKRHTALEMAERAEDFITELMGGGGEIQLINLRQFLEDEPIKPGDM